METNKILEIINDVENKPNKDLFSALIELENEFEKTKKLIIDLTKHMDSVEESYNIVNNEISKRLKK